MLKFRNIDADPDSPVENWGTEGILCAFERGNINDWRKIWKSINIDKSQKVIADVAQVKNMLSNRDLGYSISRIF